MMGDLSLPAYSNAGTGTGGINNYYDGFVAAVQDLLGGDTNLTAQVLDAYWSNFITPADIVFLHTNGFNSVRVPFTFEEFYQMTNWANNYPTNGYDINTGFTYLDRLVGWCSTNGIYVIPDLHCAPGGPNNFSVTNYGGTLNTNTASVFASAPNLALAGHIWTRIASHYATNGWIGGYDLLNEPVNTSGGGQVGSPTLANTYSNLVKAIRAVDPNHLLLCEGDYYASTLWDVANTGWTDPNSNLAFSDHDYGSTLPLSTDNRSTCVAANVPIWGGEFGINSTRWYNRILATTYENPVTLTAGGRTSTIVEGHCFWAYKSTQFYTLVQNPQTPGWNALKAYWASGNTSPKPSVTNAFTWLMSYAQAVNFSNCLVHIETLDSLTRTNTTSTGRGFAQSGRPYKAGVTIPGKIFAVDYDMGDSNITYLDAVSEDQANRGPVGTLWNNGSFGRCDGVDNQVCADPGTLLKVGWNDAGEWQRHSVICTPGTYNLYLRYAGGASGGQIKVSLLTLNGTNNTLMLSSNNLSGTLTLPSTGSYTAYSTYLLNNVVITNSGAASLQFDVVSPGYDLVWAAFVPAAGPPLPPLGEARVGAQLGIPLELTTGLEAVAGNGESALNWVASDGATGYAVKRAFTSGGPYATVAYCAAPSYLDTGLSNGLPCFYVVTSTNAFGESAPSAEANATPQPTSLPTPWMDQDVGVATRWNGDPADVGWPGSGSFGGGLYSVSGAGVDIWNNADSFHFVFRAVAGDCTNIVRVASLQNTDPWAKAGLMLRETLNQDSANAFIAITAQNGGLFSYRSATAAGSASFGQSGLNTPYWVKLVRLGNSFTAYTSPNGSAWTQTGSPVTIPMAGTILVGLAVTAHDSSQLNTATFGNLSVAAQLPAIPANLLATPTTVQITLNWSSAAGAASYTVRRSTTNGGPYTVIATSVLATNWLDTTVANGTTYYYVVSAASPNGESVPSNQAAASVPLPALSVASTGTNIVLSWPVTATAFALYSTTNLAPPIFWTAVTNATTNSSGSLVLPVNTGSEFFRLISP
jgi:aryl-phospho-beta-D-glucosidase BglC (GH1 family)